MTVTESNYEFAHDTFASKPNCSSCLASRCMISTHLWQRGKAFSFRASSTSILEAFEAFDPAFRQIAAEFFANNWIDAEIRKGKRGGAFCASPSPTASLHSLNYDDNLRRHDRRPELGHGLHGCLSRSRIILTTTRRSYCRTASSLANAGFDHLLGPSRTAGSERFSPARSKIFRTVFRQNVLTRFEELAFSPGKKKLTRIS